MAFLLGSTSGASICRYERLQHNPNLKTLLAYEFLFRTPVRKLFPGVHQGVERDLIKRIRLLARKLAKNRHDRLTVHKLGFLNALSELVTAPHPAPVRYDA